MRTLLAFLIFALTIPAIAQMECPQSQFNTMYWITTPDGVAHQQAGVDVGTANILYYPALNWYTGPTDVPGIFTLCRTTYFRDNGAASQVGKNAFVSINHLFGTNTSRTNQDQALWVSGATANDSSSYYGVEAIQAELDINGSPNFIGAPDSEASTLSLQLSDSHTGYIPGPTNFGVNGMRITYFREAGAGNWQSVQPAGARIRASNYSTVPGVGAALDALSLIVNDYTAGKSSNIGGVDLDVGSPLKDSGRFPSYNWGIHIQDFGTNASDYNFYSASGGPNSGKNLFQGPVIANAEIRTGKTANTDLAGVGVIPYTMLFSETYTTSPVCTVSETSGLNPIMVQATKIGFTVSGTAGDSFTYICIGRN
ncbi:MAG TPA: hypothetical protein VMT67_15470 [Terriglobales bacterium]|nr:hypothetical protein [Terriglobales bacterium]